MSGIAGRIAENEITKDLLKPGQKDGDRITFSVPESVMTWGLRILLMRFLINIALFFVDPPEEKSMLIFVFLFFFIGFLTGIYLILLHKHQKIITNGVGITINNILKKNQYLPREEVNSVSINIRGTIIIKSIHGKTISFYRYIQGIFQLCNILKEKIGEENVVKMEINLRYQLRLDIPQKYLEKYPQYIRSKRSLMLFGA